MERKRKRDEGLVPSTVEARRQRFGFGRPQARVHPRTRSTRRKPLARLGRHRRRRRRPRWKLSGSTTCPKTPGPASGCTCWAARPTSELNAWGARGLGDYNSTAGNTALACKAWNQAVVVAHVAPHVALPRHARAGLAAGPRPAAARAARLREFARKSGPHAGGPGA